MPGGLLAATLHPTASYINALTRRPLARIFGTDRLKIVFPSLSRCKGSACLRRRSIFVEEPPSLPIRPRKPTCHRAPGGDAEAG